jgi:hypothetical protein
MNKRSNHRRGVPLFYFDLLWFMGGDLTSNKTYVFRSIVTILIGDKGKQEITMKEKCITSKVSRWYLHKLLTIL